MLSHRVAEMILNYGLKVLVIGFGSLTMMPLSIIEVFCDRCILPRTKNLLDETIVLFPKDV